MEKELNQTTQEQVEAKETKEKEVDFAETRKKIEQRYQDKLTKAQAEFASQLELANQELEFYKTQLPQIQQAFKSNGGNLEYFNDWLTLNKSKIDFKDLDKSIISTFETTKWAKAQNNFNATNALNNGAGDIRRVELNELVPGTVYKKPY